MPDESVLLTTATRWGVRLTLNRPAKLNALNGPMMAALLAALDAADALALALCHLWRSPMQNKLLAAAAKARMAP